MFEDGLESSEPTVRAVETGDLAFVPDVSDDVAGEQWRQVARSHGFSSVVSVPILAGDVSHGVLGVYFDRPRSFDERTLESMVEGGELLGFGLSSMEARLALLAGHGTEVALELPSESCLNGRLAERSSCVLEFESVVPQPDGAALAYVTVTEGETSDIQALTSSVLVDDVTVVRTTRAGPYLRLSLTAEPLEVAFADRGIRPVRVVAGQGVVRVTAQFPPTLDVASLLNAFSEEYPGIEVVAQRRTRPGTNDTDPSTLLANLSDRQREIVQAAYENGYFDSPRRENGEQIAERFDIAPSTFYDHLRAAQQNLFAALFSDRS